MKKLPTEELILGCAWSILGEIPPQVRAVSVEQQGTDINVYFIYAGFLSEEELEDLDTATDEFWNQISSLTYCINSIMKRVDPPQEIPIHGELVYLRKEPE